MSNLREPAASAVIAGSFAHYVLVKGRSVLQLVVEIPVEAQAAAFAALGYPMPGIEIPVAVARLNPLPADHEPASSEAPRERPAATHDNPHAGGGASHAKRHWYDMPPSERAGIMCKDKRFWKWIGVDNEDDATNWLYMECGIDSRSELKLDPEASQDVRAFREASLRRFYEIERDSRAGLETEPR